MNARNVSSTPLSSSSSSSSSSTAPSPAGRIKTVRTTIYVLCIAMSYERKVKPRPLTAEEINDRAPTLGEALCCTPCADNFLFDPLFNVNKALSESNLTDNASLAGPNARRVASERKTYKSRARSLRNLFRRKSSSMSSQPEILIGNAFDVIFVERERKYHQNSNFLVNFGKEQLDHHKVLLEIRGSEHSVPSFNEAPATARAVETKQSANASQLNIPEPSEVFKGYPEAIAIANANHSHDATQTTEPNDENCGSKTKSKSSVWFPVTRLYRTSSVNGQKHVASIHNDSDDDNDNANANNRADTQDDPTGIPLGCCQPMKKTLSQNDTTDGSSSRSFTEPKDIATLLAPFLQPGKNSIRYLLIDEDEVIGVAYANIFVWAHDTDIVLADIDGTITKSNVMGIMDTILTEKYEHVHDGICDFLSGLGKIPNTQLVYVTSRPIVLATRTRKFLNTVRQVDELAALPDGPLFGFGGSVSRVLMMELFSKNVHTFKSKTIWDQLVQPFVMANKPVDPGFKPTDIFLAAFGNSWMDVQAYHMIGIDFNKIYFIDKKSHIQCFDGTDAHEADLDEEFDKLKSESADREDGGNANNASDRDAVDAVSRSLPPIEGGTSEPKRTDSMKEAMEKNDVDMPVATTPVADTLVMGDFKPVEWYKERMGTTYVGYSDRNLLSRFLGSIDGAETKDA